MNIECFMGELQTLMNKHGLTFATAPTLEMMRSDVESTPSAGGRGSYLLRERSRYQVHFTLNVEQLSMWSDPRFF